MDSIVITKLAGLLACLAGAVFLTLRSRRTTATAWWIAAQASGIACYLGAGAIIGSFSNVNNGSLLGALLFGLASLSLLNTAYWTTRRPSSLRFPEDAADKDAAGTLEDRHAAKIGAAAARGTVVGAVLSVVIVLTSLDPETEWLALWMPLFVSLAGIVVGTLIHYPSFRTFFCVFALVGLAGAVFEIHRSGGLGKSPLAAQKKLDRICCVLARSDKRWHKVLLLENMLEGEVHFRRANGSTGELRREPGLLETLRAGNSVVGYWQGKIPGAAFDRLRVEFTGAKNFRLLLIDERTKVPLADGTYTQSRDSIRFSLEGRSISVKVSPERA